LANGSKIDELLAFTLSGEEMSRVAGYTLRAISMRAAEGYFPRPARGQYNAVAVLQGMLKFQRERAGDAGDDSLSKQRARLTRNKADMAELERGKLVGDLLPADEVLSGWSALFAKIKARMLAIPSKVAPRLVGLKTAAQAKAIIEPEVYEALEDASNIEIVARRDAPRRGGNGSGRAEGSRPAAEANDL
jgi:phage terminase Nu1 subunit (DNA packaging protein)